MDFYTYTNEWNKIPKSTAKILLSTTILIDPKLVGFTEKLLHLISLPFKGSWKKKQEKKWKYQKQSVSYH